MNWLDLLLLKIFIWLGSRWFNVVDVHKNKDGIVTSISFKKGKS